MKTSCFKHYTGNDGVAICVYPPKNWAGQIFPSLAPDKQLFYAVKNGVITKEEYEKRYRKDVLSLLNPREIYDRFKNNVLLCWEEPIFDKNGNIINEGEGFCHRHIVSKWLEKKLNIIVSEWTPSDEEIIKKKSNPLF